MDLRYIKTLLLPSLRAFKRDVGDPHFLMIGTAIVIAVASVTAVDMFTDRVRNALARQSSTLLAADLAIASNDEIPLLYRKQARALNLNTTETLAMRSVVAFGESLQLTELKAVAAGYPLRGKVLVASAPFVDPAPTTTIPESGTVWVEARLLPLIHAAIGDRIRIGRTALEISKILVLEPDRGGDLFNIAPRVLLNQADIAATGLISPGSRVRYSLLLTGEKTAIGQYSDNLNLRPGDRILSPANARPEIRTALRRTEHYLGLASFTTIILAGVAIALAAASFAAKHKNTVALLRTLGATRRYVLAYFSLEVLLLGIFTATLGAVLGAGCQEIIAKLMAGWTQTELPPPMAITALHAALIGLVALVGFALPPLMTLRNVPPLRVLRSDADAKPTSKAVVLIYALTACAFIAPWRAGDVKITAWSLGGLGVCLAALILTTLVTIKLISRRRKHSSIVWQFGIANLARRGTLTVVQVAGLGLGMMVLLVLGIARNDLFDSWITNLPPDTPNQFLINIQPKDVADLERFFQRHELNPPDFYPMVRGRLTAINDIPITLDHYTDPRARRLAEREFNLSWADQLKPYNKIVEGKWWDPAREGRNFSIERDIAKTLGLSLGDTLTYRVADQDVRGIIANLRSVQWDSMKVNFFVEASKALLTELPATFITSFRLDRESYPMMRELIQEFPSVTIIDITALVDHVRSIMDRSAAAIEFVFLFTLVAGILVFIAAIQATQDERIFESAILKTLGASRALILRVMSAEFLTIGFIAGVVAGCGAMIVGWLIATRVLDIDYTPSIWTIVVGLGASVSGVSLVGSIAIFNAVRQPSVVILNYRN